MTQDIFVISTSYSLRGLPGWLSKRTYNTVKHGFKDRNGKQLVGLSSMVGQFCSKSGVILVHDETLRARVVTIAMASCREKAREIDVTVDDNIQVYDMRRDFLSVLADNETIMSEDAAMTATCAMLGISEDEGWEMVDQQPQAIMVRK